MRSATLTDIDQHGHQYICTVHTGWHGKQRICQKHKPVSLRYKHTKMCILKSDWITTPSTLLMKPFCVLVYWSSGLRNTKITAKWPFLPVPKIHLEVHQKIQSVIDVLQTPHPTYLCKVFNLTYHKPPHFFTLFFSSSALTPAMNLSKEAMSIWPPFSDFLKHVLLGSLTESENLQFASCSERVKQE